MPDSLSPAERSFRASIGGYAMHAQNDSRVTSAPARAAAEKRFLDQVETWPRQRITSRAP